MRRIAFRAAKRNNPNMNRRDGSSFSCRQIGWAALFCLLSTGLQAQEPAKLPNDDNGVWQWVVAFALTALILAGAFLNPKRSHQS